MHLKFTATEGGTDLFVPLEAGQSSFGEADFEQGTGRVRLVGKLNLDFMPVVCVADIDLETMEGTGHLQPVH